jgi:hypothetical protein
MRNHSFVIENPDLTALLASLKAQVPKSAKGLILLATADNSWSMAGLEEWITQTDIPLAGGLFPGVIFGNQSYLKDALVVICCEEPMQTRTIRNLSAGERAIETQVNSIKPEGGDACNALILIDGLSQNIERFTDVFYRELGESASVLGGGAGSLDFIQKPCVFTNEGIIADAAIIVKFKHKLSVGIQHGWQIAAGPHLVTKSDGVVVEALNYQSAVQVYENEIDAYGTHKLELDDFFTVAKGYPLGIEKLDAETLVRDPIKTDNNALVCVGEVPENAMVYLLAGEPEKLIKAAREAAQMAVNLNRETSAKADWCFTVDCISRVLFLEERFNEELEAIAQSLPGHLTNVGILSLGEIGNVRSGPIEWLNKTTVIGLI